MRLAAATAATAEDVAEDVAEIKATCSTAESGTAAHAACLEGGVAILVVSGTLLPVGQGFVGFLRFLELLLRLGVVRIAVGMVLHRQLAISLLDIFLRRVAVDAEDFVIVALAHVFST